MKNLNYFLEATKQIKTSVDNIVCLSAAELEHLRICYLPFQHNVFNAYVHGSMLFNDENKYSTPVSNPYREILKAGYQLAQSMSGFQFCDFRTSSALHALQILILSLTDKDDVILYPTKEDGGHASYPRIISILGRRAVPLEFDTSEWKPVCKQPNQAKMILLGYSETLTCKIDNSMLSNFSHIPVILDGAQLSGFIFSGQWNDIKDENVVVIGSTHKTLPLYPLGFILTNNRNYWEKIDSLIFPTFIRTTNVLYQLANFLGLSVFRELSSQYISNINCYREKLTTLLKERGVDPILHPNEKNSSHQIWLKAQESSYEKIVSLMANYNIHVDKKILPYGLGPGIRLGVQQIAADYIPDEHLAKIANALSNAYQYNYDGTKINRYIDKNKSLQSLERRLLESINLYVS